MAGRSYNDLKSVTVDPNPNHESAAFMNQNATTQVTKDAQAANHPLDLLASILKVPGATPQPKALSGSLSAATTNPFQLVVDSAMQHINRNPFLTPDEPVAPGLNIPQ